MTRPISLTEIVYPVFKIGSERPTQEDGVTLFMRLYEDGVNKYKVVDDKNLPGETLALRRLQLMKEGVPLKSLGTAMFFLGDLIKIAVPRLWLIDSIGNVFQYKKSISTKLQFKKITYVHKISTGGAILEIEGMPNRFKCMFAPTPNETYAGVLKHGMTYILYGLYEQKYDDTVRRI